MLKKNDLAKQFELVVQQEIKNYQDSLNFVLGSINEIKKSVEDLKKDLESKLAHHTVCHSVSTRRLNEIANDFAKLDALVNSKFNDQYVVNERNTKEVKDLETNVLLKFRFTDDTRSSLSTLLHQIDVMKEKVNKRNEEIDRNLANLLMRFRKEILKAKQEIMEAPTEADAVRSGLESKIESHRVDVEGIMRELKIYKKDNSITQKKIENIYTLIARLKKSEEPL